MQKGVVVPRSENPDPGHPAVLVFPGFVVAWEGNKRQQRQVRIRGSLHCGGKVRRLRSR